MGLTIDAIIFGLAYLNGPKARLSFGGEGATMRITDRAREALNCLIHHGYAHVTAATDQIKGREYYCGASANLGEIAKSKGVNPFSAEFRWETFVKKDAEQRKVKANE